MSKKIELILKNDWDYFPHYKKPIGHFVGRKSELENIKNWFLRREKGCFLVSGERGVGKTALVYSALHEAVKENKKIIPVIINAAQLVYDEKQGESSEDATLERNIILNLIRRLYTAARGEIKNAAGKGKLEELYVKAISHTVELRREISRIREEGYACQSCSEKGVEASLTPENFRIILSAIGIMIGFAIFSLPKIWKIPIEINKIVGYGFSIIPILVPLSCYAKFKWCISKTVIDSSKGKLSALYVEDNNLSNLEYDLYELLEVLSQGNDGRKIVFIIDELDKIEVKGKTNKISETIKAFKNLFTLSSGLFVFVGSDLIYKEVEEAKGSRDIAYTLFNDKIFLARPSFEDLENYLDEVIESLPSAKDLGLYHDFRNLVCYRAKSDFFELHFVLRDYIKKYVKRNNAPLLEIEPLLNEELFRANLQKILGQIFTPNKYNNPSQWEGNNRLLKDLYDFIDTPWSAGFLLIEKNAPKESADYEHRLYQTKGNLIDYLLRLNYITLHPQEVQKTISNVAVACSRYNWTGDFKIVPSSPTEPLDYEMKFLDEFEIFVKSVNDICGLLGQEGERQPEEGIISEKAKEACPGVDVSAVYAEAKKYQTELMSTTRKYISRETLEKQTDKLIVVCEQLRTAIISILKNIIGKHELRQMVQTTLADDANVFGLILSDIRQGILNAKQDHICYYRKSPKFIRQVLVIRDIPVELLEKNKTRINNVANNFEIINLNTKGTNYNLQYNENPDGKMRGFKDISIRNSFSSTGKVLEEIKRYENETIPDTTESFLGRPINDVTLREYTKWKYPSLEINENIHKLLLQQINYDRYDGLKKLDDVINKALVLVKKYADDRPEVFVAASDYITKSLGFIDEDFRKIHPFDDKTRAAFEEALGQHL